jgi:hypothetical protein
VGGGVVREDDADPKLLNDDEEVGSDDGTILTLAVREEWLVWTTYDEATVKLSEKGAIATRYSDDNYVLVTTNDKMMEGRHYWEVELMSQTIACTFIGVSKCNLNPIGDYAKRGCTDAWLMYAGDGTLWGNGKEDDDLSGHYKQGDRVGVLLDLDTGALLFFKNGIQTGPGYPRGSVIGPVVCALQMGMQRESARLHPMGIPKWIRSTYR